MAMLNAVVVVSLIARVAGVRKGVVGLNTFAMSPKRLQRGSSVRGSDLLVNNVFNSVALSV